MGSQTTRLMGPKAWISTRPWRLSRAHQLWQPNAGAEQGEAVATETKRGMAP
uniref:Uncharacterized protein n=1 Tax=Arundo donax TaxID=35708 RepID=A0A0A9AX43_ARUDO